MEKKNHSLREERERERERARIGRKQNSEGDEQGEEEERGIMESLLLLKDGKSVT